MKKFMDKDFLLQSETAKELYHNHAAKLPIIDYHCHLDPREVAEDHRFCSITELWLWGPLQVAGHARKRSGRTVYNR